MSSLVSSSITANLSIDDIVLVPEVGLTLPALSLSLDGLTGGLIQGSGASAVSSLAGVLANIQIDTSALEHFLDFDNLTADGFLGLLKQLGGALQALGGEGILSTSIPFTGLTLGDALDVDALLAKVLSGPLGGLRALGGLPAPADGRLDQDALLSFVVNGSTAVRQRWTSPSPPTPATQSIDDLVADVNEALAAKLLELGIPDLVEAQRVGSRIGLVGKSADLTALSIEAGEAFGLPAGVVGIARSFDSAQEVLTALASAVGATYDANAKRLTYQVQFDESTSREIPLGLDLDLGDAIALSVFVRLRAANAGPVNGQPATTSFTLRVNDGAPVVVDLAGAVAGNTDLDDLVVDLNAALATALAATDFGDDISVTNDGGRLAFVSKGTQVESLQVSGAEALGFATDQQADAAVNLDARVKGGLTLGVDLVPLGQGFALSSATLAAVNDNLPGEIKPQGTPELEITTSDGTVFLVDLAAGGTPATTVQDVAQAIQTQTSGKVTVTLDDDTDTIRLVDTTFVEGAPATFRVRGVNDSFASVQLGIEASDTAATGTIESRPLHNESLTSRFFIQDASFDATFDVGVDTLDASARFGALGFDVVQGSGGISAHLGLDLLDPGTDAADGRITFGELLDNLGNPSALLGGDGFSGSANLDLPVRLAPDFLNGALTGDPRVSLSWSDLTDPGTLSYGFNADLADLSGFEALAFGKIIEGLRAVQGFIDDEIEGLLGAIPEIPLVNESLLDLTGDPSDAFGALVDRLEADPPETLGEFQLFLQDTLAEVLAGLGGVTVSFDLPTRSFDIDLGFAKSVQTTLPLNLDLGLPGLQFGGLDPSLVGQGTLDVQAGVFFDLGLTFDVTNPSVPTIYLRDSSDFRVEVGLESSDLQFAATLGPAGLFIGNQGLANLGSLRLGSSDLVAGSPAVFSLGLATDPSDHRYLLGELSTGLLQTNLDARVGAQLPVYFPTESAFLGDIQVDIQDLLDPFDVSSSDGDPATSSFDAPDFGAAISSLLADLAANLSALGNGWDGLLNLFIDALDGDVFGVKLPLIGDQLAGAANFLADIRDQVSQNIETFHTTNPGELLTDTAVKNLLFEAIGPGGLGWLQDRDGDADVDLNDLAVVSSGLDGVEFAFKLGRSQQIDQAVGFDLGLDALGLSLDGDVDLSLGFQLDLALGVNRSDGLYFRTDGPDPELTVTVDATIPGQTLTGSLLFLDLVAQDQGSRLTGSFTVDLLDPGQDDGLLTLAEIARLGTGGTLPGPLFASTLDASANVDLALTLGFGTSGRFPSIYADLGIDWGIGPSAPFGGVPQVSFDNVQMDLGGFIDDYVGGILAGIDDVVGPLDDYLSKLQAPIPVLSDVMGRPVSLIDLARILPGSVGKAADFLDAVADIADLANLPLVPGGSRIDLGSFDLGGADIRNLASVTGLTPRVTQAVDPKAGLPANVKSYVQQAAAANGGGFHFAFLDNPSSLFGLLLGQDPVLFTYDMPALDLAFDIGPLEFPIIPPLLKASVGGHVEAHADFAFGFDTLGLRAAHDTGDATRAFEGFYVSDTANPDGSGEDVPEVTLSAGVLAGVGAGIPGFAEVKVEGGVIGSLELDLHDDNGDGRIRPSELLSGLALGPLYVFDGKAKVDARLVGSIHILFVIDESKTLADTTLFEFDLTRPDTTPVLAHVDSRAARPARRSERRPAPARQRGRRRRGIPGAPRRRSEPGDRRRVRPAADLRQRDQHLRGRRSRQRRHCGARGRRAAGDDDRRQRQRRAGGAGRRSHPDGRATATTPWLLPTGPTAWMAARAPTPCRAVAAPICWWAARATIGSRAATEATRCREEPATTRSPAGVATTFLYGGDGADTLQGDDGVDHLYGEAGPDLLVGGRGDDFLYGGSESDVLQGGIGADTLQGDARQRPALRRDRQRHSRRRRRRRPARRRREHRHDPRRARQRRDLRRCGQRHAARRRRRRRHDLRGQRRQRERREGDRRRPT